MADSSLDDFFAKKDKSKKKARKQKISDETAPPKIEDREAQKKVKTKKPKDTVVDTSGASSSTPNTDSSTEKPPVEPEEPGAEWRDFEQEETEKDYSVLKIQNLQIRPEDAEKEEENVTEEPEFDEDGEEIKREDKGEAGPWNAVHGNPSAPAPGITAPAPEPPKPAEEEATKNVVGGKYVPPSLRGAGGAASSAGSSPNPMGRYGRKKAAPNIQSEDDFPTLGQQGTGRKGDSPAWGSDQRAGNFERVQSGGRQMEDPNRKRMELSLGNRYASLQD